MESLGPGVESLALKKALLFLKSFSNEKPKRFFILIWANLMMLLIQGSSRYNITRSKRVLQESHKTLQCDFFLICQKHLNSN